MPTAPDGMATLDTADEPAFFWLPDATLSSPRFADGPGDPISGIVTNSTGNGIGVRVSHARFTSQEQNGAIDTASPAIGLVPAATDSPPGSSAGQDDEPGFHVQNEAEPDEELPPNNAPIAVDDTASVDEDGSVVIDVVANDTDADGDALRVDGWAAEPPYGTLELNADGTVTYTPFRDFSGEDTFTYNVTDGRDTTTATITVTVAPVNDAPVAFHDGFTFRNTFVHDMPEWPNPEQPYQYQPTELWSVRGNDYDVDSPETLTVSELDFTGTVGTVTVDMWSGVVEWAGPTDFTGETSFRYKLSDGTGGVSDWATARLWSYTPQYTGGDGVRIEIPPEPAPVAVEDVVPIGDQGGAGEVLPNDTNGYVAVVATHPSYARLTSFGFDGTFGFEPGTPRENSNFTYRLFGPGGIRSVIQVVQMPVVSLEVFNGQGGKGLRDEDEESRGAFTVANWNDTDGDAVKDSEDVAGVRAAHGVGVDEVDLMRVVVNRPTVFPAGKSVSVVVANGSARMYTNPYREGASFTSKVLGPGDFAGNTVEYWLEADNPSTTARVP